MRKAVFWLHLMLGLASGLVLGIQSVTGALLAYEPALLRAGRSSATAPSWAELEPAAKDLSFSRWLITRSDAGLAAQGQLSDGRLLTFPTATTPSEVPTITGFLATTKEIHRWFAAEGPLRDKAKIVTGASAATLVALSVSGLVLWWPRTRLAWRSALSFPRGFARSKTWWRQLHLAVGFWLLVPLLVAAITGTLLAFPWLLDPAPKTGARPSRAPAAVTGFPREAVARLTELAPHWTELELRATPAGGWQARIRPATDAPGFAQDTAEVGPAGKTGALRRYSEQSTLLKFKAWVRYAHTGEAFALWGQTLAFVTSLALLPLLWSGVTLSLARLDSWRNRRASA